MSTSSNQSKRSIVCEHIERLASCMAQRSHDDLIGRRQEQAKTEREFYVPGYRGVCMDLNREEGEQY